MKKICTITCCFLLLVFIISGCKKEEAVVQYNGGITATVDGKDWTSYSKKTLCSTLHGKTTMTGTGDDGSTINITFNNEFNTSKIYYFFSPGEATALYIVPGQPAWSSDLTSNGGMLIIDKLDTLHKLMSGRFYFYAYRQSDQSTVYISNGSFYDINYGIAAPGQPVKQNTFSVKVDGNRFAPEIVYVYSSLDFISINANDVNWLKRIGISFPSSVEPGNYTIYFFSGPCNSYYADGIAGSSGIGNLKITYHNRQTRKIEGRFEFSTMSTSVNLKSHNLTDGSFSVIYQ